MADETPPLDAARLAEIRATLSDEEGMSDLAYRFTSEWASVRFKGDLAQAAIDLLAEVERLRTREAALLAFVREVAGDHEHIWEAVDPQEVWACEICHDYSHDYALDVQTRAQFLASAGQAATSEAEWDSKEQALQKSIAEHQRVIAKIEARYAEQGTYNHQLVRRLAALLPIVQAVAKAESYHAEIIDVWVLLLDNPSLSYAQELLAQARALLADC